MRRGIERLPGAEHLAAEGVVQEIGAAAVGPMQDQHGPSRGSPYGGVMQPQFGKRFSGVKLIIADHPVALGGGGIIGRG
jgi:hypothetical protein